MELEVDGPDVVRVPGGQPLGGVEPATAALAADLGPAQALFAPQALRALPVDDPAPRDDAAAGGPSCSTSGDGCGRPGACAAQLGFILPTGRGGRRCVVRGWSTTRLARRSETSKRSVRAYTARRRRSGVTRSFPWPAPSTCRCRGPGSPPVSSSAGSRSRVP